MRQIFWTVALIALLRSPGLSQQTIVADECAVRVLNGNVCGSGNIAGFSSGKAYVLTNAHVAGTSIGHRVSVDVTAQGIKTSLGGTVVWAGFSSERLLDAAVLEVPGLSASKYRPLIRTAPVGTSFETRGSPRCVWPLVSKKFLNAIVDSSSPLIRGDPDAIGGQSGSAITNADQRQIALLTWSWGGKCAGQQTHWLYRLAANRSILQVPRRPDGLIEVQNPRAVTEDGVFHWAALNLQDLPIWFDETPPDVPPDGDCHVLSSGEWKLIQLIRERGVDNAAFDWSRLISLILELLNLFKR